MRKGIYVILPVFIALALRLYPYLISGLPFSTDAWAPIRNTELLIEYTPIPLNDKIFDGYNNYWPANSLFGAVISEITSLDPMEAMAIFLPTIGATTILIFYALVKRLCNAKISFIASIIFGTAFTHAFFTAGVTKETYANPIYVLLILIFLHPTIGKQKQVLLFTITSVALALTHHLTSLIAIFILSSIALANFISNTKKGLASSKSDFLLVLILTAVTSLYYGLYAQSGLAMPLTSDQWLSVASYQLLPFALAVYLVSRPYVHTSTRTIIVTLATVASAFLFILLTLSTTIVPGFTPTVQEHVLIYVLPYFITLPFITLGYGYQRRINGNITPLFWLTPLIGLEAYAFFSNSSQSIGLWIRTPDFLYPPLAILSAAGLYRVYKTTGGAHLQRFIKPAVMAIILVIATINVYSLYAAVSLQDRYLGYQWLYRVQEFKAGAWIATTSGNDTVAGDMKVVHLMRDYFQVNVDVIQGYRYLTGNSESEPQILFIYDQMLKNGYVLGLHGVDLPEDWTEKASQLNLIYSNGLADLYAG
jgi:hypothetical protein